MTVMEKDIRWNIYGAFWRRVEVQSHLFRFRVCFRVGVKGLGIKEDMGFFVTQVLIGLLETTSEILFGPTQFSFKPASTRLLFSVPTLSFVDKVGLKTRLRKLRTVFYAL